MKFWIVTPSYNQLDWLKLCIASVADQATESNAVDSCSLIVDKDSSATQQQRNSTTEPALQVHHHIQDACSTDGTVDWLRQYDAEVRRQRTEDRDQGPSSTRHSPPATPAYTFSYSSERDAGMYDAINKGWKLAPDDTDVIAHLNCDEQYLPGALQIIADFFSNHWKTEVVLADLIVIDKSGGYICHRRSLKPYALISRFCCGGFTATTFQRASVTKQKNVFFDTSWKNFGDKVWYNALHRAGCRFAVCNELVAVFADTGANLNWTEQGRAEKRRYEEEFLWGSGAGTRLFSRVLGLRRLIKEHLIKPPTEYSLYRNAEGEREDFQILKPTGLWHKKWKKD